MEWETDVLLKRPSVPVTLIGKKTLFLGRKFGNLFRFWLSAVSAGRSISVFHASTFKFYVANNFSRLSPSLKGTNQPD
jgi:hypothetical protein